MRLDNLRPGEAIIDSLMKIIADVDFVCAVLKRGDVNPNVLFEIGLAAGAGKPVVILAEPGAQVPLDLASILTARMNIENGIAIENTVDSLLEHVRNPHPKRSQGVQSHVRPIDPDSALERLDAIWELELSQRGMAYERLVRELFEEANIIVSSPSGGDTGIDLVVWLDGIDPVIGNPLLVEIKGGEATKQRVHELETRLLNSLGRVLAPAGVLIWFNEKADIFPKLTVGVPLIFVLSIRELIGLLAKKSLASELVARRNRAVHGQSS